MINDSGADVDPIGFEDLEGAFNYKDYSSQDPVEENEAPFTSV